MSRNRCATFCNLDPQMKSITAIFLVTRCATKIYESQIMCPFSKTHFGNEQHWFHLWLRMKVGACNMAGIKCRREIHGHDRKGKPIPQGHLKKCNGCSYLTCFALECRAQGKVPVGIEKTEHSWFLSWSQFEGDVFVCLGRCSSRSDRIVKQDLNNKRRFVGMLILSVIATSCSRVGAVGLLSIYGAWTPTHGPPCSSTKQDLHPALWLFRRA